MWGLSVSDTVLVSSIRDQTATDVNKAARLPHFRDFLQSSLGCGLHHQVRPLQIFESFASLRETGRRLS